MTARRVAHVLRKYDPAEWGGTETHVAAITAELAKLGWAPEVHAPQGPVGGEQHLAAQVPLRRYHAFNPFLGSRARRRALEKNAGNIASVDEAWRLYRDRGLGLVHLHTGGRVGAAARFAMRRSGRPYLISVHGPLLANAGWVKEDTQRRYQRTVDLGKPIGLLFGARRVFTDAARVVTFNEDEKQALERRFDTPVVRMDHGVDLARMQTGRAERALEKWPALTGAPVVLLLGRLCAQKNQKLAIRAFAKGACRTHQLVLAGAATDLSEEDALRREIAAAGLVERVHLLGNVDKDRDVPDLLALAQLLIVPSSHEAFGLVALEAWAAGKPALLARRAGLKDLMDAMGPAALGVPSLEADDWGAALTATLNDASALDANARAGQALVRARYSWPRVASRLAALYEEILTETPRR